MRNQNKVVDERVESLQRKIVSQAYVLVLIILCTSIFAKIFMYDNDLKTYMVEMMVIMVTGIYMLVRFVLAGINPLGTSNKTRVITMATIVGTIVAALSLISNYEGYQRMDNVFISIVTLLITFAFAFGITIGTMLIFSKLSQRKAAKLENKYDS